MLFKPKPGDRVQTTAPVKYKVHGTELTKPKGARGTVSSGGGDKVSVVWDSGDRSPVDKKYLKKI